MKIDFRRLKYVSPSLRRFLARRPKKAVRSRVAKLRTKLKERGAKPRFRVEEYPPVSFSEKTLLTIELPEGGRLVAIDLFIKASATTADTGSPSQPKHWWVKALDSIEIKDGGTTIVRYHPYALRVLTDLVFDVDIPESGTTSTSTGDSISVEDIIRIPFTWNVREDSLIEQFPFDASVGINLMDKTDPKIIIDTGSLGFTDTNLDSFQIFPVLYIQETKSKIVPEAWADYKVLEVSEITLHELKLTEDKFHILDFLMFLDSNGDIGTISKVELKDIKRNYTYMSLEYALTKVVRTWCEQSNEYGVIPIYLGYFRNIYVESDKATVIKVKNPSAGKIILQQLGYVK